MSDDIIRPKIDLRQQETINVKNVNQFILKK